MQQDDSNSKSRQTNLIRYLGSDSMHVGDLIQVWWFTGSTPPNYASVLAIEPYRGRYPAMFDVVVRLTAPNTRRGWMEMAYDTRSEH